MATEPADAIAALERRISSIETKYAVATGIVLTLAAIFGITGAWGAKLLGDAYRKIDDLQKQSTSISDKYVKYESELKDVKISSLTDITATTKSAIDELSSASRTTDEKMTSLISAAETKIASSVAALDEQIMSSTMAAVDKSIDTRMETFANRNEINARFEQIEYQIHSEMDAMNGIVFAKEDEKCPHKFRDIGPILLLRLKSSVDETAFTHRRIRSLINPLARALEEEANGVGDYAYDTATLCIR